MGDTVKLTLSVESNNAAFVDEDNVPDLVLGTLLAKVASQVDDGYRSGVVMDPINGQRVGSWVYTAGVTE
jgi:hypothetical protein